MRDHIVDRFVPTNLGKLSTYNQKQNSYQTLLQKLWASLLESYI
jgi:hypothetical protein